MYVGHGIVVVVFPGGVSCRKAFSGRTKVSVLCTGLLVGHRARKLGDQHHADKQKNEFIVVVTYIIVYVDFGPPQKRVL